MRTILKSAIKISRKSYRKIFKPANKLPIDLTGQAASDLIKDTLSADAPCMISRFGSVELSAVLNWMAVHDESGSFRKSLKTIFGESQYFWWDDWVMSQMSNVAGFFPSNPTNLSKFAEKTLEDVRNIDILGSWSIGEKLAMDYNSGAKVVELIDLDPYFHSNPWTEALGGKKVLVIHPFASSIRSQYQKHNLLFRDARTLPAFDLQTIKAEQTVEGSETKFKSWFNALDAMRSAISQKDFDIAIIGAGAYGMPLASHVKDMGKKAIHLGGSTQILFGIKGKRWDERSMYQNLYNEHWTRPLLEETPKNADMIERGCYW